MASTGEPFGLFWDSENGDRTYSAASFEYWLKKFFTSGVFNGDLQVQATSGMTIKVGAGYANVDGKVKFWNAEFNLTLNPANSTYPRIDTIVITRDNVNREIRCEVVTGGYSGDTPQPTAPVRNAEIYQLVLAQIYVANGATGITQAEITDTRPNTDLCGWITGTVTELDFEQFTVQFESYFAQFKRQHETEWSLWEIAQKAAYAAWLSEVKAQQIQDKADWDAWYAALQEELHELPADTAEYLQIEIDEIKESGTTGSILHITTTNSELEGKTVTVSCGTETRTGTFDSNLECTIIGFKSVGTLIITSTDGIQTAVKTVDIDYYSKYEIAIAFWAATVNIQGDDNLKGVDVVVKDSDDTTITTITLNAVTGQGVFEAQKADTYTFNYTVNGTAYSVPLAVTEETTYELSLTAGFDYKQWVTLGGLDPTDYASLSEVFADEVAVRRLMTIHASADYLIEKVTDDIDVIDDFVANDTAMKWIGLRDYVCDGLTAIAGVKAKFLASQYWERYLKDHVPIMTSNTAPYGTASSSVQTSGYEAYKSFASGENTTALINGTSGSIQYKFTNPINIKKVTMKEYGNATQIAINSMAKDLTFKVSNDETNWIVVGTASNTDVSLGKEYEHDISYTGYYLYFRIEASNNNGLGQYTEFGKLQFYGRSLNVSVPVMTSNIVPYGEVIGNTGLYDILPYIVFNGDPSTEWQSASNTVGSYHGIGYEFINKVVIKSVFISMATHGTLGNGVIQGSNDGNTWEDVYTISSGLTENTKYYFTFSNSAPYKYYRVYGQIVSNRVGYKAIQFYGVDYSELEFTEGSTMKYLYDHGVEFETFSYKDASNDGDKITLGTNDAYAMSAQNNLTNYSTLRAVIGDSNGNGNGYIIIDDTNAPAYSYNTWIAYNKLMNGNNPNTVNLSVASINQSLYCGLITNKALQCKELWLE